MNKKRIIAFLVLLAVVVCICKSRDKEVKREFFAMDTYMTVVCYGDRAEEAAEAAVNEVRALDERLSAENPDSEISLINSQGYGKISADTSKIIKIAGEVYSVTDGCFDITIYPLMKAWGFTDKAYRVPAQDELLDNRAKVNGEGVSLGQDDTFVRLYENQQIDLGGIAKGYASDRIMGIFEEYGLTGGIVSLGGNIQFYGKKPKRDISDYFGNTGYSCGVKDPNSPTDATKYIGILKNAEGAVITSGAYERYFEDEATGKKYHHILNPATGYPAESDLKSVTIVSSRGVLADALSTALYVMGRDKACEFWRQHGNELAFEMCLMDDTDRVYITKGLAENFESEYNTEMIE